MPSLVNPGEEERLCRMQAEGVHTSRHLSAGPGQPTVTSSETEYPLHYME